MDLHYTAEHLGGMAFAMDLPGDHRIVMDSIPEVGGQNLGPTPKQLVLVGLAGCTGMDVVSLLKKMQVPYESFRIELGAHSAEEHPRIYDKIHLSYCFTGEGLEEYLPKIERAVTLSTEKYCGVHAMLAKAAEITHDIVLR